MQAQAGTFRREITRGKWVKIWGRQLRLKKLFIACIHGNAGNGQLPICSSGHFDNMIEESVGTMLAVGDKCPRDAIGFRQEGS